MQFCRHPFTYCDTVLLSVNCKSGGKLKKKTKTEVTEIRVKFTSLILRNAILKAGEKETERPTLVSSRRRNFPDTPIDHFVSPFVSPRRLLSFLRSFQLARCTSRMDGMKG